MRTINTKRNILLCAISLMMVIGLTGCFKGNISVDVSWDGSAVVSIAFGMTAQAQALVSSQGTNPLQDIEKSLADTTGNIPTGIEVKRWHESDYDWVSATRKFSDLQTVNQILGNKPMFNRFSLTRNRGVLRDEFILDAEFDSLNSGIPADNSGIDPSAFINLSFSARLPGTIVETNGFADLEDPNLLMWNAQGYQNVPIRARSLSWNWLNLFLIMGGVFGLIILGVYAFGGFDSILHQRKRNPYYLPPGQHALPQNQPALQSPAQNAIHTTNYIVELGLEDLLNQVNARALNSSGEIRRQPMEIALLWKDAQGQQRYIHIKDLGNHEIEINGQNHPATRDNAKAGIMNVLQKHN